MANGSEAVTYGQLEDRSNQAAQLFRSMGLEPGDCIALLTESHPRLFELCWAAQRSGLYYLPINWHLTTDEIAYIIEDSGAAVLLASVRFVESAKRLQVKTNTEVLIFGGNGGDFQRYEGLRDRYPRQPVVIESAGSDMLYTSGTTGVPKGVRRPRPDNNSIAYAQSEEKFYPSIGFRRSTIHMAAGPLYHASPLHTSMQAMARGGTCVLIDRFDAENALGSIEQHKITHINLVPTHFMRLLQLPNGARERYDLSSLQVVLHGAAPCPVHIKEEMIRWLGPILVEYYGGTEAMGGCSIDSAEWLLHKGSVGRTNRGTIHIVDPVSGCSLPPGKDGKIYFENPPPVVYNNKPEATASMRSSQGWGTFGDIGHLDEEGYLYLTDREDNLIISGGVNVYPQEAENRLMTHPAVADAAVFGIPSKDFGEEVHAVIEPISWEAAGPDLAQELVAFCRAKLSSVKCPRSIEFQKVLPRGENGKLYKDSIREQYWNM